MKSVAAPAGDGCERSDVDGVLAGPPAQVGADEAGAARAAAAETQALENRRSAGLLLRCPRQHRYHHHLRAEVVSDEIDLLAEWGSVDVRFGGRWGRT